MVIAIDGPAGSGKSSTAKKVAAALGIVHLDTGAMYRAITLKCLEEKIPHTDHAKLGRLLARTELKFTGAPPDTAIWMDGRNVTTAVRGDEVTKNVSDYCAPMVVRDALVDQQRTIGDAGDCVCEGRDIGTVVFPRAELKIFMVASVEERARRRMLDFEKLGIAKSIVDLCREIEERDHKDSTRVNSPLKKADDALELDTTRLTIEQQVAFIVERARRIKKNIKHQ
jgi:CMP/dCMP kinase